jgi:hypothetical protein
MSDLNQVLGALLQAGVSYATTNKVDFEAKITAAGVTFATHGETLIDSAITNANLGVFLNAFKSTIVSAINSELNSLIASGVKNEVDVLYDLALSAGAAEAAKLAAS